MHMVLNKEGQFLVSVSPGKRGLLAAAPPSRLQKRGQSWHVEGRGNETYVFGGRVSVNES